MFTGYNPNNVNDLVKEFIKSYDDINKVINEKFQEKIVNRLVPYLVSKNAVHLFADILDPELRRYKEYFDKSFSDIIDKCQESASLWANRNGSEYKVIDFETIEYKVNVSVILEVKDDARVANKPESDKILEEISGIISEVNEAFENSKILLEKLISYIGGEQQSELIDKYNSFYDSMSKKFEQIMTSFEIGVKTYTKAYVSAIEKAYYHATPELNVKLNDFNYVPFYRE